MNLVIEWMESGGWIAFAICILVQVTVLSAACLLAIRLIPGRYATHDIIGRTGLILIFFAPILSLVLPGQWIPTIWPTNTRAAEQNVDAPLSNPLQTEIALNEASIDDLFRGEHLGRNPVKKSIQKRSDSERIAESPLAITRATSDGPKLELGSDPVSAREFAQRNPDVLASPQSNRVARSFPFLLLCVWFSGSIVIFTRSVIRSWNVRRLVQRLVPADLPRSQLIRLARQSGLVRVPTVVCCSALPTPCILGRLRPVVAIPSGLLDVAMRKYCEDALLHEFAHLARKDHWIALVQSACHAVFWPHPLVRWLNQSVSRTCEEICDNRVLAVRMPIDYADSLLRLSLGVAQPAALGVLNRHKSLEDRIADLLSGDRDTRTSSPITMRMGVAGMLLVIAVAIGGTSRRGVVAAPLQSNSTVPVEVTEFQEFATIAGTVKSSDDTPLQNGTVTLFRFLDRIDPVEILQTSRLAADGSFAFEGVGVRPLESGLLGLGIAVTAENRAAEIRHFYARNGGLEHLEGLDFRLGPPASLVGVVTDPEGRPLGDAVLSFVTVSAPVPGILSATTDANGKFLIRDLSSWDGGRNRQRFLQIHHPDHATILWPISKVPSILRIQMKPSAVVSGRVVDQITGKGVPGVTVTAQGVRAPQQLSPAAWHETRTDDEGLYEMKMLPGRYNIRADVPDRVPLALDTSFAKPVEYADQDILVVKGSLVSGSLAFGDDEKIPPGIRVAVKGPSRPPSGSAVSSTLVKPDGTFQIRVAPGRNYLYLMNGAASVFVDARDGRNTSAVLVPGVRVDPLEYASFENQMPLNVSLLLERRRIEQELKRLGNPPGRDFVEDQLRRLAELNGRGTVFKDAWLLTLKSIVDAGETAVPVLTEALEDCDDNIMLRCLAFMLRALGDERAIAPLIRAYPKTRFHHGSDMGCHTEHQDLAEFARKHDLDKDNDGGIRNYGVGRPLREFIGALQTLTGQDMNDLEINSVTSGGTPTQDALQHNLYTKKANQWVDWYNQTLAGKPGHEKIAKHELVPVPETEIGLDDSLVTDGSITNGILSPPGLPKLYRTFLDLDTQRAGKMPAELADAASRQFPNDKIDRWARDEGYDLMCVEIDTESGRPCYVLRMLDAQAHQLPMRYWDGNVNGVTRRQLVSEGQECGELLIPKLDGEQDPFAHSPFLVRTNLGTVVIVKVGVEIRADSKQKQMASGDLELKQSGLFEGRRIGQELLELAPIHP